MTQLLQPDEYDVLEIRGRQQLPNRVIEAFHPETFNATGYPVHVTSPGELWRYIDVMHETRLEQTVNEVLGGLTDKEIELFASAVRFMTEFTQRSFGRVIRCENALLRAMNIYRYIRVMNPRVVLELGPGSGYLGLLVILDGRGYIACENTQAFYLMQNRVWGEAAGGRFVDLAKDPRTLREILSGDLGGMAVHVPWWKVVDLDVTTLPGSIDVVTANHCLTEMQPNSMKYYLRLASALLRRTAGIFMFEGWGYQLNHPRGEVAREFSKTGYALCHADGTVVAYAAAPQNETYGQMPLPVPVKWKIRNLLRKLAGFATIPYEYYVGDFAGANRVSRAIASVQVKIPQTATHKYGEIMRLLFSIYDGRPGSEEEEFLALIGHDYL
jgi:hypothetical protein